MIEFKNVNLKNDHQKNNILEDINLKIEDESMIAIIGKSGIGKSTLLNSIVKNCLITNGDIFVNNKNIISCSKKELKEIRKSIGWITQDDLLLDELSVYDNLKLSFNNFKNPFYKLLNFIPKVDEIKIYNTLSSLSIEDKVYMKINQLSGGQKKRVQIAKLLLNKYKIILADEPTSNLDLKTSLEVISTLKKVAKENNSILIIVIHDIELLKKTFDKVIALKDKKIFFNGNVSDLNEDLLNRIYK